MTRLNVRANSSHVYTADLKDETGADVNPAILTAATLTIQDASAGTTLVSGRNVLNANGVTFSTGSLRWEIAPSDLALVDGALSRRLRAELTLQWAGAKQHVHAIYFYVRKA